MDFRGRVEHMDRSDQFYHTVRLDKELCKGCMTCMQRCPTQAIRIRNGKAKINKEFCISCGECIRVCPHHAKIALYDPLDRLKEFEYKVALPAPSLYMQFNNLDDTNIVLNALKDMNFDDVFEVSAAAELVSEASRNYIAEHREEIEGPFISTACPSVVRLIRILFPNLLPNLLPFKPPIEVAAILAAEKAMKETGLPREKICIAFISPCPSKTAYVRSPLGVEKSEVDRVLAIKDLYPILLAHMKAVSNTDYEAINNSGKIGISWGARSGEASGLLMDSYMAADGMENIMKVLEELEDEKFQGLDFVELNACNGGCVGGVLTVENPYVAEARLKKIRKYMPVSQNANSEETKSKLMYTKEIEYEPVFNLGSNMIESFSRLNKAERIEKQLPGLNCGTCGAPNCKALSQDIVKGEASENDCIYFLRQRLHDMSGEIERLSKEIEYDPEGMHVKESLTMAADYFEKIRNDLSALDRKITEE